LGRRTIKFHEAGRFHRDRRSNGNRQANVAEKGLPGKRPPPSFRGDAKHQGSITTNADVEHDWRPIAPNEFRGYGFPDAQLRI
jgi:hypothetical protein